MSTPVVTARRADPTASDASAFGTDNIAVCARFRPLSAQEIERDPRPCVRYPPNDPTQVEVTVSEEELTHRFAFRNVYGPDTTQQGLYQQVGRPVVEDVMAGYNGTILAYGQTGSGKTFTMLGPGATAPPAGLGRTPRHATPRTAAVVSAVRHQTLLADRETMGVIPRAVEDIFGMIHAAEDTRAFTVSFSYVEVYMERVRDLLDPTKTNLALREDIAQRAFYVADVTRCYVTTAEEVHALLERGTKSRAVAGHKMNELSSRSHSIASLEVKSVQGEVQRCGKLFLVDLAGSEKVSKTQASGMHLEEAKLINKSLTTLGLVISNLTDRRSAHIPYRDSKLTRLLQDSLGGNSRTTLIVCCSPSVYNDQETLTTLRFGARATKVQNHAVVNDEVTYDELKTQLSKLEGELAKLRGGGPVGAPGLGTLSDDDARRLIQLEEQAVHLDAQARRYRNEIAALREELTGAALRERVVERRAARDEAMAERQREEIAAWEREYGTLWARTAAAEEGLAKERATSGALRTAVAHAAEAFSALQAEIELLRPAAEKVAVCAAVSEERVALSATPSPARALGGSAATDETEEPVPPAPEESAPLTGREDTFLSRAVTAEQRAASVEATHRELSSEYGALRLELELGEKRLAIRNERIEHLKHGLQLEKRNLSDMQDARDAERRKLHDDLHAARSDAAYWRTECDRLKDVARAMRDGVEVDSALFTTPYVASRFVKQVRGGHSSDSRRTEASPGTDQPRPDADATPLRPLELDG